jgi:hypothetical protein
MKKLMTLMLGLCFVFGTVAMSFAQDKSDQTKSSKKKSGKKKSSEPTKSGSSH